MKQKLTIQMIKTKTQQNRLLNEKSTIRKTNLEHAVNKVVFH